MAKRKVPDPDFHTDPNLNPNPISLMKGEPYSGQVSVSDFKALLKMSGFCLRATQLQEIADVVTVSAGKIDYSAFLETLITIVRKPLVTGGAAAVGEKAVAEDWEDFEAALGKLSLGS